MQIKNNKLYAVIYFKKKISVHFWDKKKNVLLIFKIKIKNRKWSEGFIKFFQKQKFKH